MKNQIKLKTKRKGLQPDVLQSNSNNKKKKKMNQKV